MKKSTLLFIALLTISSFGFSQTVIIGTQTWTSLNLDVIKFRNGDFISQAKTDEEWEAAWLNKQAAWCYYKNDFSNGTKYGKLYNWYAVNDPRGLAPLGWHIPTDKEWSVLSTFLGGEEVAVKKMKNSSGWKYSDGNNSSGFSGLPGGYRYDGGGFLGVGKSGYWWSASRGFESIYRAKLLSRDFSVMTRTEGFENAGFSVRCVKD